MLAKQVGKDNISGFLGHIEPLITDIEISIAFNSKWLDYVENQLLTSSVVGARNSVGSETELHSQGTS